MDAKTLKETTQKGSPDGKILDRIRVSDSGQFSVSMDSVRKLPSFKRDLSSVAKIREKLSGKR